ncbi:MAG: hypothetical protein IJ717_08285 [Treponema sp.]|nr:hypothetical protein [Treponema sp.]
MKIKNLFAAPLLFEKISILSILFVLVIVALLFPHRTALKNMGGGYSPNQKTLRIDLKNANDAFSCVEITNNSDSTANIQQPVWFFDETGQGTMVMSDKQTIDLTIKCIEDGEFSIALRGIDFRQKDDDSQRVPVCITLTSFTVNGEQIINSDIVIWHDNPIYFKKSVLDGESINFHAEWKPFEAR